MQDLDYNLKDQKINWSKTVKKIESIQIYCWDKVKGSYHHFTPHHTHRFFLIDSLYLFSQDKLRFKNLFVSHPQGTHPTPRPATHTSTLFSKLLNFLFWSSKKSGYKKWEVSVISPTIQRLEDSPTTQGEFWIKGCPDTQPSPEKIPCEFSHWYQGNLPHLL